MDHSKKIIEYHNKSKHHVDNYADSLGYLDWVMRPKPFRFYENVETIRLPRENSDIQAGHFDLYQRTNNKTQELSLSSIGQFLNLSLALSAWKGFDQSRWSLRVNPSSGNLHPTEAHLILPQLENNNAGIYHYNVFEHLLEKQAELTNDIWSELIENYHPDGFFIGLSTIYWRQSWKYGVRGFRYVHLDLGHILGCLSFAANLLGWKCTYLNVLSDEDITYILGLNKYQWIKEENEQPGFLCYIGPYEKNKEIPRYLDKSTIQKINELDFKGDLSKLSDEVVPWKDIDKVIKDSEKKRSGAFELSLPEIDLRKDEMNNFSAIEIIKKRRSAESFDGSSHITKELFFNMLDKTLARKNHAPFDAEVMDSNINLLLYVHRVAELPAGLYFFIRNPDDLETLKKTCHRGLKWIQVEEGFPLYLLHNLNLTNEAKILCCQQDIGGTGAFSLAMIGKFKDHLRKTPHMYKNMFWEAGLIGQVLYLESEAYGIQGTGVGSFYDNLVIEMIGIKDMSFQSLYHFTVGVGVKNLKHNTYAAYYHIDDAKKKNKELKVEDYETF